MTVTITQDGTIISKDFGALDQEQNYVIGEIKALAQTMIFDLEGGSSAFKLKRAKEQDEMDGGFQYQTLVHKIETVRKRSNEIEAIVMGLDNAEQVALYDYFTPMNAPIDIGEIPAVLTPVQFQTIAAIAMGENGIVRFGDVINSAEAMIMNNGGVRYAMDRYAKATSIVKHDAEAMLRSLIDAGVEGFSEDDLNAVMAAWPIL